MRLLKVFEQSGGDDLPKLVEFQPDRIPKYAILSHRWSSNPSDEVQFADLMQTDKYSISSLREKKGYKKLQYSCLQARKDKLDYIWNDTCCIDKSSSAELSEAINSMYAWYNEAAVCYGYLEDVPSTVDLASKDSKLTKTAWATRGWTLQELLAPSKMIFYSGDWHEIGTRESLSSILSTITGIDEVYLTKGKPVSSASIAKRMSWAARRETTRPEDIAYCLMGLFQVNMPMLYGEGVKAFIRLQEEIMKHSDDHSLFAWTDEGQDEDTLHGLLAKHPRYFQKSGSIEPYEDREVRAPFSMSNRGLCIELHLTKLATETLYAAALDCPVPPAFEDSTFLAIYLEKLPSSHGQYARVRVGRFGEARLRGRLQTIYVRQSIIVPDVEGVFPTHIFQLRKFTTQSTDYRVVQTMIRDAPNGALDVRKTVKTTQSTRDWMPAGNPTTCKVTSKGDTRALFGIQIAFQEMESVVILLGTADLQVGFSLVQTQSLEIKTEDQVKLFEAEFHPARVGSNLTIGYHRICVSTEPLVTNGAKYYMIDIQLNALERPRNLVDEVLDAFDDLVEPDLPIENRRTIMGRLRRPFGVRKMG